jgi:hypothetical protein
MKRPRTKRPIDFSSQKFCNETSLGQNGPWNKAVLGQNIRGKFETKRPIFRDGLSVPENKTLYNFFGQNVPGPQKTSTATAPRLLP